MQVLESRTVQIFSHQIKVDIILEGSGQAVKCFVAVNDRKWTSWNLCNHKRRPNQSFNEIKEMLMDGSYQMFI
jgi:hypothetical protein